MAITELEQEFIAQMAPQLNRIWWTCNLKESCTIPNTVALVGDGLRMASFNIDSDDVVIHSASPNYLKDFSEATPENPIRTSLQDFISAINTMVEKNTSEAVQTIPRTLRM